MIVILLCLLFLLLILYASDATDRPFYVILSASFLYYCVAGTFYWVDHRQAYFLGFSWGRGSVYAASELLAFATVLLAAFVWLLTQFFQNLNFRLQRQAISIGSAEASFSSLFWVFYLLGIISSFFVLINSSSVKNPGLGFGGAFFQIAYQCSDILIPVIAYSVAKNGYSRRSLIVLTYFVIYCVFVGLRYKLALIFFPLLWFQWIKLRRNAGGGVRWLQVTPLLVSVLAVFVLFSLLTLYRQKFGIPSFSSARLSPDQDWLYGVFAEANIIFGLRSIMTHYADAGLLYPMAPILDSLKAWLPHAFFPDRITGEYLLAMRFGYLSETGFQSGTAYPWIGEYIIMWGYAGLLLGPLALAGAYSVVKTVVLRYSGSRDEIIFGLALLAVVVGYYNFSRGYFPQILKAYVFVVIPYIVLCSTGVRRIRRF